MGVVKIRGKWAIEWYAPDGKRRRKVIGGSHQEAVKAYRDTKARLDRGEPPLFATSTKTVAEAAMKYWEVCRGTWAPTEANRVRSLLDHHLLPFFGGRRIANVKQLHVEEYVAKRQREKAAPSTINKEVMRLRHLFNKSIQWGEISRNPCQGVKRLKEPPPRLAYLDADERARLLVQAEAYDPTFTLRNIVVFAMLTGARLSEILSLTWSDVDLDRRLITFRQTKSGRVRYMPIHSYLVRLLQALEKSHDPTAPLFPSEWNRQRVTTAFRRVAQSARLKAFRFHDLRHDFASWLSMSGVPIRAVQTLLGHSDLRMTERYTHLAEQALAAAIQALPALPTNDGDDHAITFEVSPTTTPVD